MARSADFSLPPLSLALAGLPRSAAPALLREQLDAAAALGYRSVTLDATLPGIRPRELDRSARRDLASLLRRRELSCAGLDLWIPPEHFSDPREQDRALAAVVGAIELAADLARLSSSAVVSTARSRVSAAVSLTLATTIAPALRGLIEARASTCGVRVADHAFPVSEERAGVGAIGIGLDPALVLLAGNDPPRAASQLAASTTDGLCPLAVARLADASTAARTAVGAAGARLDTLAYAMALVTAGYRAPVVVELRGLLDPVQGARAAIDAWSTVIPG